MARRATSPLTAASLNAAPAFAALGDATRLAIVRRLGREGPLSITQLTAGASITRQAVSKHLRALEQARLVSSARSGRECRWQLRQSGLREVRNQLEQIAAEWDDALARLRSLVETNKS